MISATENIVQLDAYCRSLRPAVVDFLSVIPQLYPHGRAWLEKRLNEVEEGRANCTLAFERGLLVGALIDVGKGRRSRKISTILVSDHHQRKGVGSSLFERCRMRWLRSGVDNLHVTVASERDKLISDFLLGKKFCRVGIECDRYGPGRDEFVYSATLT